MSTTTILDGPHSPRNLICCLAGASASAWRVSHAIMQVEDTAVQAHRRLQICLAVASVLLRRPPKVLTPQTFDHIQALLDDVHFKPMFGLAISEFQAIHHVLQLPKPVCMTVKDVIDSRTVFLMLLAWLRGSRQQALEGQFGWSQGRTSRVIHHISAFFSRRWCYLLNVCSPCHCLTQPRRLDYYAAAIKRKTHMPLFWGAVDGTICPIALLTIDQENSYNSHKQVHAVKWQFIVTPDGLLFLLGLFDGHWHNAHMVNESLLVLWAMEHARGEDGEQQYLYGDQAYVD